MKAWPKFRFRASGRRLEITSGGKWFLFFTVAIGAVAVNSGNNIIYLIESLLLSSLLFSGAISDLTVNRVRITRTVAQAEAGRATGDHLVLENLSRFPLYCVEAGEWAGGRFHPLAFVFLLPAKAKVSLYSGQVLAARGRHDWDGLAIATSFPFGFARKIRILPGAGTRLCWPESAEGEGRYGRRGEWEWASGEIEEADPAGDARLLHWPSTAKSGRPMARPRRPDPAVEEVELNLDSAGDTEARIRKAAGRLKESAIRLWIKRGGVTERVEGRRAGLDALALLPKEEA